MFKRHLRRFIKIFPDKISMWIVYFYGHIKRPRLSYSQKGEDLLVSSFFKNDFMGYYLDIGGFHPRWISNTHILSQRGWRGTVVDLDEQKLNFFHFARGKSVKTIKAAVCGEASGGHRDVYRFRDRHGFSDIDTLDRETADEKVRLGWGTYDIGKIDVISINSLLEVLPPVNFLNIDVEGLDTEIILHLDLLRHKIDLILFEDTKFFGGSKQVVEKLTSNGYEHLFTSGGSVCFALTERIIKDGRRKREQHR